MAKQHCNWALPPHRKLGAYSAAFPPAKSRSVSPNMMHPSWGHVPSKVDLAQDLHMVHTMG